MIKIVSKILLIVYCLLLIYVCFFARRRIGLRNTNPKILVNLIPLKNTYQAFNKINPNQYGENYNFYSNFLGNIALFIPYPFFINIVFKISRSNIILISGFLASMLIELLQYIFVVGVADVDDIILNTLGVSIGLLIYNFFKKNSYYQSLAS